jgi:GT2 family glycosyltransferase
MSAPLVVTVILNTNRGEDTLACLTTLADAGYRPQQVIVLDNASTDGSPEVIARRFPEVELIHLKENLGYAGNNNVGIERAMGLGADWVFVLNEDTIVAEDCITRLIDAAGKDPQVGIVGPMVYHFNEPGVIQSAGGMLDKRWQAVHMGLNEEDCGQYALPRAVDYISGCAILVKREVIEQIGGLEADLFYYWEETDWCTRTREHGWKVLHVPQAHLWHKGVQRDYNPGPSVTYYNTRNRLMFLKRHHAPLSVWLYAWGRTLLTLTSWTVRPKWRTMHAHRDAMWQGTLDFLRGRMGMRSVQAGK